MFAEVTMHLGWYLLIIIANRSPWIVRREVEYENGR